MKELISVKKWTRMDDAQKIAFLQGIEDQEAQRAGRASFEVKGKFLYTSSDGIVLGTCNTKEQAIYINDSQFYSESLYGKNPEKIIKRCLHESRHATQYRAVNGLASNLTEEVKEWKDNFRNYIKFSENPRAYHNQPVEADARSYAETRYRELSEGICYENAKNIFESQMDSNNESNKNHVEVSKKLCHGNKM